MNTVIAVGMGVLIGAGAAMALKSSQPNQPQNHLEAYNSVILNAGADINLTPEDLEDVVASISDKKTLAREAVAAIRPAKADGAIEFEGHAGLTIPSETIAEVPANYEPPVPLERTVNYAQITVMVAASDKDRHANGWAGSVPGVTDSRKPFILDESIEPSEVHGRTRITADVIVHERFNKSKKEYQVHSVEIVKIYPLAK